VQSGLVCDAIPMNCTEAVWEGGRVISLAPTHDIARFSLLRMITKSSGRRGHFKRKARVRVEVDGGRDATKDGSHTPHWVQDGGCQAIAECGQSGRVFGIRSNDDRSIYYEGTHMLKLSAVIYFAGEKARFGFANQGSAINIQLAALIRAPHILRGV
jgi:hypothetical protein